MASRSLFNWIVLIYWGSSKLCSTEIALLVKIAQIADIA